MEQSLPDLRYASRQLSEAPGFTLAVAGVVANRSYA